MLFLRLAILIVLFLVFVSSFDYLESIQTQYQREQIEKRKGICILKPDYGKCKGRRSLWYFNDRYGKCLKFTYSNCGGNLNRFYTKESCEEYCDKVDWTESKLKRKSFPKWITPSPKENLRDHA